MSSEIGRYAASMRKYKHRPQQHPVIVLIDSDSGAKDVFKAVKNAHPTKPTLQTKEPFYFLDFNLYLVKTPEMGPAGEPCIDDLFDKKLLKTTLGGKTFSKDNEMDNAQHYGKFRFADQVVRPNVMTADFSGFKPLFDRIEAVLADYNYRKPKIP